VGRMKRIPRSLLILLGAIGGLLFFWLVVLKLASKLMGSHGGPCPSALSWLVDNPVRRRYTRPVLDRVGIQPGETVLEVGPGPGAFTVDAARRAGTEGKVFAVDIQPKMIAKLEQRLQEASVTNVEARVASAYDLPIEDGTADRAFLITVLPEIPDPVRALREIRRVLGPGGRLSVTEEFTDPDYPLPRTTIRWAEAAGFQLEERYGNFWVYTLNFRRKP
jgi:ubiquinone/menaquinone biosynthesis C-methylase UbiE